MSASRELPGGPVSGGVPSPCISVCRVDAASGWCEGCYRSIDEIAAWGSLGEREKLAVWRELPLRRDRARAATRTPMGTSEGTPAGTPTEGSARR